MVRVIRTERSARVCDNSRIQDEIRSALDNDPRIPHASEIAVWTDGIDVVSLRGTVGSWRQRRSAMEDARRVPGVFEVIDELSVDLRDHDRVDDHELCGRALQLLMWDRAIPGDQVDVTVKNGWVTLRGDLDDEYQSDAAFDDVSGLAGGRGVTNEIRGSTRL